MLAFYVLGAKDYMEIRGSARELPIRPVSSAFLGLPYRILNINHKKELLSSLWVSPDTDPSACFPSVHRTTIDRIIKSIESQGRTYKAMSKYIATCNN